MCKPHNRAMLCAARFGQKNWSCMRLSGINPPGYRHSWQGRSQSAHWPFLHTSCRQSCSLRRWRLLPWRPAHPRFQGWNHTAPDSKAGPSELKQDKRRDVHSRTGNEILLCKDLTPSPVTWRSGRGDAAVVILTEVHRGARFGDVLSSRLTRRLSHSAKIHTSFKISETRMC